MSQQINHLHKQLPVRFKNKGKWTLKEMHHTVSTYIDFVKNDINALIKQPTKKSNLAYKDHLAMEELAKRKDLTITNANKGEAVVIMDIIIIIVIIITVIIIIITTFINFMNLVF